MLVAWRMIKDPLVKQRSQTPPLTVAVTMQTTNSDMGQGAKKGHRTTLAPQRFLSVTVVLFISHVRVVQAQIYWVTIRECP